MRTTQSSKLTLATLVPRDVMGALDALGIDAEERGNEASALCPHPDHNDRSPSWSCNLDTGEHHCFACGFGGSFAYLVACMLGLTRGDSSQWIRDRKLKDIADGHIGPRESRQEQAKFVSEADLWPFVEPPVSARNERGLTLNACTMYGVRWEPDDELWITLVRDKRGRLLGWQEKNARQFNNYPRHLVKSGSLFGYDLLPVGGTALLVESPLDAPYALPACQGLGVHPVASFGASVSREQIAMLTGRAGRIILAMDNDEAGWKSVAQVAWSFGTVPVSVFNYASVDYHAGFVHIGEPDGRDPGNLSMDEIAYGIETAHAGRRIKIPWL